MLPPNVENALRATAAVTVMDITNMAEHDVVPEDQYPLARRIEVLDDRICPLCEELHGQVFDRRSEAYQRYRGLVHINCRGTWSYIHRDEQGPDGRPSQPNFKPPAQDLLDKHGHFIIDPNRYEPLNVIGWTDMREFVFKRVLDPVTGRLVSRLFWNIPPREDVEAAFLAGLLAKAERQIVSDATETAYVYDKRGNELLVKSTGSTSEVTFTIDEQALMEDAILTHNHPSGNSLSKPDVVFLFAHGLEEIRAVGRSGSIRYRYALSPDAQARTLDLDTISDMYSEAEHTVFAELWSAIQQGTMTVDEANRVHHHEVLMRMDGRMSDDGLGRLIYRREEW